MSSKDLKKINDLAKTELTRVTSMTKEEARQRLIDAGIFNKNGKYTPPYKNLAKAISAG